MKKYNILKCVQLLEEVRDFTDEPKRVKTKKLDYVIERLKVEAELNCLRYKARLK